MHRHSPSCLPGPVSRHREAWQRYQSPTDLHEAPVPLDARGVRVDLVARIRREIAAGTYDTEQKWEAALDRLLGRLEGE
jgi:hypothetical protein